VRLSVVKALQNRQALFLQTSFRTDFGCPTTSGGSWSRAAQEQAWVLHTGYPSAALFFRSK
jgi:hypothetical protein